MKKSHMNVVSNEQVSNVVVSNEVGSIECGLNCLHTLTDTFNIKR